jgi:hypothetical protein
MLIARIQIQRDCWFVKGINKGLNLDFLFLNYFSI